jgi:hypothetical protein
MPHTCPIGAERPLTAGEVAMVRGIFGSAIDTAPVRIRRKRWFPFQTRNTTMAPCGHLHFAPGSMSYCDDFSHADPHLQGHFIHEMTHVWQTQRHGRFYLIWRRHPFCRYSYCLKPGWSLEQYGLEQQAEIVRHAFMLRKGWKIAGVSDKKAYEVLVDF